MTTGTKETTGTSGKFTARFTTGGRLTSLEDWLAQHAKGKWSFKLEDVSEDMSKKNYVVLFNDKEDRDLFRQRFSIRKPVKTEPQVKTPSKVATVTADILKSGSGLLKSASDVSKKIQAAVQRRYTAPAKALPTVARPVDSGVSVTRSN